MPGEMDEIVAEFLVESYESLDRLDRDLLALERDPHARDVLASIFRTMHTIKGTCGFLGFVKLERIAHAAETLLSGLRDGSMSITPQTAGVLLATGDVLRLILRQIEASGTDGEDDHDALVEELGRLREAPPDPAAPPAAASQPASRPPRMRHGRGAGIRTAVTDTTVRVDVSLLDRLMTLVGELVLARNHLVEMASDRADPALTSATQSVDRITAELQEGVMKTRLQPIRTAWGTFPRVARDLAVALDKRVRIETDGDDTELDRSIIEAIKDPLTHIVRNAVDHGIEGPEVRVAAGKPDEGVVLVRAYHEGGQVTIEVADDGAGIDLDAVRAKAVETASMTPEEADRMSEYSSRIDGSMRRPKRGSTKTRESTKIQPATSPSTRMTPALRMIVPRESSKDASAANSGWRRRPFEIDFPADPGGSCCSASRSSCTGCCRAPCWPRLIPSTGARPPSSPPSIQW